MTAVARETLHTIATRARIGTAVCAVAAAAVLTPTTIAHAAPPLPTPALTGSIGSAAAAGSGLISPLCDPVSTPDCASIVTPFASSLVGISALIPSSIFQNRFVWLGTPNPTPPTQTTVFEFYPLALIPGFLLPLVGWFNNVNFEACIGGLTLQIGPYGTVSGRYSRGCA
jgi:hypothetical protein